MRFVPSTSRRGFSLIELLMAIFILGIGVISIASLFPAGIAQQRQSVDDVIGPTVARNAMALLRTKLRDEDFSQTVDASGFGVRVQGDFPWVRPAFFVDDQTLPDGTLVPRGSIGIFQTTFGTATDSEIPWNDYLYGAMPPLIVVSQAERSFPMSATLTDARSAEYYWECMFRRYQGRLQVAVFVYRVIHPPGERVPYFVAANPSNPDVPPLPIALDLTDGANAVFSPTGAWDAFPAGNPPAVSVIPGTAASAYDPADARQAWQLPRQWILDQNNNLHRVLGQFRDRGNIEVELVRPVPEMANVPVYYWSVPPADTDGNGLADQDVVQQIWYVPAVDGLDRRLEPVFLTVEEL